MAASIGTLKGTIVLDDKFSGRLVAAAGKLDVVGRKWEAVGTKMASTGAALTRSISLPLAAVGGAALVASAKFETSMTKMETLVGLTREEVQGFRADILLLSGETARAPKELADAMFFITSAGIRGGKALDTLKISAQAAAIGLGDTEVIADAVTSAMNAYAKVGLTAADATNILAGAVRAGKLEAESLAPVLGNLLPAAASLGISFEDVAGVLAVMSKTGLDAANASTSLNAIMTTLRSSSPEAAKVLASVGLSMAGLRDVAAQPGGLIQVMRILEDKLGDNVDAFSTVIPNIRAAKGAFTILAQEAGSVDDVMAQVAAKTDIVGQGMKRVAETTGFKFQQFLAKLSTTGIEIGDKLVPAFETLLTAGVKLLEFASKAVELFGMLPTPLQNVALGLGAMAIAAGPLLSMSGNLTIVFGKMAQLLAGPMTAGTATAAAGTTTLAGSVKALGLAFTGLSIGILAPIGIVAAIALFSVKIAKAKADAEEAAFVLAELNGEMVNGALAVNDVRLAWQEAGEQGLQALLDTMDPAIIKSKEFSQQLGDLLSSGRVTQEQFQGIADTVFKYREQMELAVEPTVAVGDAGTDAATALSELNDILDGLGVTTAPQAMTAIGELTAALESGLVPPEQMITLLDGMGEEFDELGLRDIPMVEEALQRLNSQYEATNGILDTAISKHNRISQILDSMPPFIDDVGISAADMALNWDQVGFSVRGVEPPFRAVSDVMGDLGIKIPNVSTGMENLTRAVMSGDAPVRQMVQAIRSQRDEYERLGVLTPDLDKKLRALERTALENATAADKAALGFKGLFDGLKTGIPFVDGILGKFRGFLGLFGKITGALGSLGGAFGGFFSKLGGGMSSLFSGGGGGGGGSIFGGIFSSIKGMFTGGSKGEQVLNIAATDASSVMSALMGGGMGKAGVEGATGMLGGLQGILGAVGPLLPLIGPLLTVFGPMLFKGLKAIGAKIGGFFKGLFGGPSGAELAGRGVASEFTAVLAGMADAANKAEIAAAVANGATQRWAEKTVVLKNAFLALGKTEAEALSLSDALWKAEKQGPEAVQKVIDGIQPSLDAVTAAMESSGLTLNELRDLAITKSIEMGITVAAAFEAIANGTIDTMQKSVDATAKAAEDNIAITDKLRDAKIKAQQDVVQSAQIANSTLIADATTTADRISTTMTAGLRFVEGELMSMSDIGSGAFGGIAAAADMAAEMAEDRFASMREKLTGQSIIIDMVDEASASILTIGDAAEQAAKHSEDSFSMSSMSPGHGGLGGDPDERRRRRARMRGAGSGDSIPMTIKDGAGNREAAQFIVDGQLLATAIIKASPRALGNRGLRKGS